MTMLTPDWRSSSLCSELSSWPLWCCRWLCSASLSVYVGPHTPTQCTHACTHVYITHTCRHAYTHTTHTHTHAHPMHIPHAHAHITHAYTHHTHAHPMHIHTRARTHHTRIHAPHTHTHVITHILSVGLGAFTLLPKIRYTHSHHDTDRSRITSLVPRPPP